MLLGRQEAVFSPYRADLVQKTGCRNLVFELNIKGIGWILVRRPANEKLRFWACFFTHAEEMGTNQTFTMPWRMANMASPTRLLMSSFTKS